MIILNGVLSDAGVKKIFSSGSSNFTFPIGVSEKYTPVSYNFGSNGNNNASIRIKPVNSDHPFMFNANGDELAYYWNVVSSGFGSAYSVNQVFQYNNGDVSGNESNYYGGRFTAGSWTPLGGMAGTVNAGTDRITLTGVDYLDGEYTAGETANFYNKQTLYSRQSGNWTDGNTWSTTGPTGAPCGCTPNGNQVIISSGHVVTLDSDHATAYSVNIQGTLDAGNTVFHNLGHVSGNGTIKLSSTPDGMFTFPGGNFDVFMITSGSTIEFFGNNNATLPLKPGNDYKPYQNVIFSGTGIKYISAEDLKILGNLVISPGTTLNNTLFNRKITILGNWTDNNTSANGGFVAGTGNLSFNGTAPQILTIANGATTEQFYNFTINNSAGLTLAGNGRISVSNNLYLTSGNLNTSATNLLSISNSSTAAIIGGGSNSFINGPMQKRINAGSSFNFPVGDASASRYGNLYVSSVSKTGDYIVQYYSHNPGIDGYDPDNKVNPIDVVSDREYWSINGPAAATANVRVRWDSQSGIIPADAASRTKLRVVGWNGSDWVNKGNIITDNGQNSGTIQTNPVVSVSGDQRFTIGVESLPTALITSSNASICDNGATTNISIDLTGTAPWTIRYKINGGNETTINNIASSPYTLVVSNAMEPLASQGPGNYIFNVSYIRDAGGSTGIRDFTKTVTITLNDSPVPVISGNQTVAINENNVIYSTPLVSGHTYLWTYSGTAGTIHNGVVTGNTLDMHWGSVAGAGWVQVTETATSGGCFTTSTKYNITITDQPNPLVTGPSPVCNTSTVVYRTAKVGTHTYLWTLPLGGGSIVGVANRDSVVINWTSAGNFSVMVAETGSVTQNFTLPVIVNPLPAKTNAVSDPVICGGQTANIVVTAAAPGITYQLHKVSDNSVVGSPVSSGPGGDVTLPVTPLASTNYYVMATNEYTCSDQLTDIASVTVNQPPVPTLAGSQTVCEGNVEFYTTDNVAGLFRFHMDNNRRNY